ncbi:MAG TPA: helix-turn-helix domain-containing protein [Devosia sp.]|jgi:chromosomal replication initiation ATPase DnaA|nr:helix-turn-helix domain-containing protein [Devosia sp.]
MSASLWKTASEDRLRIHIRAQDDRFQRAMREELEAIAAERGLKLLPRPKVRKPRDILNILPSYPSPLPMSDAQRILREVCSKHEVTKAELTGGQRGRAIVLARQEASYRLKKETTLSLPQIGRKLGGRDHTTILHAVRRHAALLAGLEWKKPKYSARGER